MTNGLFAWAAEQIEDRRRSLETARKLLETDEQYNQAQRERTEALLLESGEHIEQAARILQRDGELKGDSYIAFNACLQLALRDIQMALHDPAVVLGTDRWLNLSEWGGLGAKVKWGDRTAIDELYKRYAKKSNELGLSMPSDIYYSFVGDCDEAEIKPPKMKTFRNHLALVRKELGLK